jgi:hypothetical protein
MEHRMIEALDLHREAAERDNRRRERLMPVISHPLRVYNATEPEGNDDPIDTAFLLQYRNPLSMLADDMDDDILAAYLKGKNAPTLREDYSLWDLTSDAPQGHMVERSRCYSFDSEEDLNAARKADREGGQDVALLSFHEINENGPDWQETPVKLTQEEVDHNPHHPVVAMVRAMQQIGELVTDETVDGEKRAPKPYTAAQLNAFSAMVKKNAQKARERRERRKNAKR